MSSILVIPVEAVSVPQPVAKNLQKGFAKIWMILKRNYLINMHVNRENQLMRVDDK